MIHPTDAAKLELLPSSLLRVTSLIDNQFITGRVLFSANFATLGSIGIPVHLSSTFKVDDIAEVVSVQFEEGKNIIHKMLRNQNLTEEEIKIFVRAISNQVGTLTNF